MIRQWLAVGCPVWCAFGNVGWRPGVVAGQSGKRYRIHFVNKTNQPYGWREARKMLPRDPNVGGRDKPIEPPSVIADLLRDGR